MEAERREVLFLGRGPGAALRREIEARGCIVAGPPPGAAPVPVERLRAVVANLPAGDPAEICGWIRRNGRTLADYGIRLEVVSPDDATLGLAQSLARDEFRLPNVRVRTLPSHPMLAESIARRHPGRTPRLNLDIAVADGRERLRKVDEPLFQRAFSHCSRVTLIELSGGRSEARVFAAHMVVTGSYAGIWPQPAFVKLDSTEKIEREYRNYRDFAERYVPFGLRPNVQATITGAFRSLLVGDFVDNSESLWDLARRGVASQAITSLADESLRGWWDQGYAADPSRGSVASAMKAANLWDADRIVPSYPERAAEAGVAPDPSILRDRLFGLRQTYRHAPIHGDLHGENVRVRNGQAILIDMANVVRGPISADRAALETWLAFELPPEADKSRFGILPGRRRSTGSTRPQRSVIRPARAIPHPDCDGWRAS